MEKIQLQLVHRPTKGTYYKFINTGLQFIRNKKNHFRELPEEAKILLGSTNESYLKYFSINFPNMIIAVDAFIRTYALDDPLFQQYYENPNNLM